MRGVIGLFLMATVCEALARTQWAQKAYDPVRRVSYSTFLGQSSRFIVLAGVILLILVILG